MRLKIWYLEEVLVNSKMLWFKINLNEIKNRNSYRFPVDFEYSYDIYDIMCRFLISMRLILRCFQDLSCFEAMFLGKDYKWTSIGYSFDRNLISMKLFSSINYSFWWVRCWHLCGKTAHMAAYNFNEINFGQDYCNWDSRLTFV